MQLIYVHVQCSSLVPSVLYMCLLQLSSEWSQLEVINVINDGTGLGFGIIGGKSTGVVLKTILPGAVADRVMLRLRVLCTSCWCDCVSDHVHVGMSEILFVWRCLFQALPTDILSSIQDGRLRSNDHMIQIGDVNVRSMGPEQVAAVLRRHDRC